MSIKPNLKLIIEEREDDTFEIVSKNPINRKIIRINKSAGSIVQGHCQGTTLKLPVSAVPEALIEKSQFYQDVLPSLETFNTLGFSPEVYSKLKKALQVMIVKYETSVMTTRKMSDDIISSDVNTFKTSAQRSHENRVDKLLDEFYFKVDEIIASEMN